MKSSRIQNLLLNFTSIFSASTISRVFTFLYFTIMARYLGAEQMGIYGYLFVFIGFGNIIADFGINRMLIRDIARQPSLTQSYLTQILSLRALLSILSMMILYGILHLIAKDPVALKLAPLALLAVLPFSFALTFDGALKANEKMRQSAIGTIGFELIKLLLLFAVVKFNWGLWGVFSVILLAYWIYALWLARYLFQAGICFHFASDFYSWQNILKLSFPFALLSLLELIHGRLDLFLLKTLLPDATQAGYYFVAYRLMDVILILPAALNIVLLPRFSRDFAQDAGRIKANYRKLFLILLICGIVLVPIVYWSSDLLIRQLFGEEYIPSINLLRILTISMFCFFIHYANVTFLAASNIQWKIFVFSIVQVTINLAANLVLIPRWGADGAAWANNISTTCGLVMFTILVNSHLKKMTKKNHATA